MRRFWLVCSWCFSVVVVLADVVAIPSQREHVKDFSAISNAVLITFNLNPVSQENNLNPEQP